jgi:hypothetical protein
MFKKFINYIKSFFIKKEPQVWLLFGSKKILCYANSLTNTFKECGHDENFLLGVYTSQKLAEYQMNKINRNLELSYTYSKLLNRDKYYACFIIPYQLNKQSSRLESLETQYHEYKIMTNRSHQTNSSRRFPFLNWFD